jgi:DNA polymerase I
MASKSYWSYGKVNHKDGAMIPEGRVLIDTAKSFVYTESGLKGVLMASRLAEPISMAKMKLMGIFNRPFIRI